MKIPHKFVNADVFGHITSKIMTTSSSNLSFIVIVRFWHFQVLPSQVIFCQSWACLFVLFTRSSNKELDDWMDHQVTLEKVEHVSIALMQVVNQHHFRGQGGSGKRGWGET